MLYSHNLEDEKLNLFSLFLSKVINGESSYTPIVNDIIEQTHLYVCGKKDLYEIKRDSINIVLLLAESKKDFFKKLDKNPERYNKEIYTKVLDIVQLPSLEMPI